MKRKQFIIQCGLACIGGATLSSLAIGCASQKITNGTIIGSDLVVPTREFEVQKGGQVQFRRYVLVQHAQLQYPICIYRSGHDSFTALWMRCTHQGTELQVFGDMLHCPGHGSEFNNKGEIVNGPAANPLRTFPVTILNNELRISLK